MKRKTIFAFALVLALLFSLSVPAFAGTEPSAEAYAQKADELQALLDVLDEKIAVLQAEYAAEIGNRRISVEPEIVSLFEGEGVTLTPSVLRMSEDAPEKTSFTWSAKDSKVAVVSAGGNVTALSPGKTVVVCAASDDPSIFCETEITVSRRVTSIELTDDKWDYLLEVGEEVDIPIRVLPGDATDSSVTWASSDSSVASVSNDGRVTAVAPGTVWISCTANDMGSVTKSVRVRIPTIKLPFTSCTVTEKSGMDVSFVHYGDPADLSYGQDWCGSIDLRRDGAKELEPGVTEYTFHINPREYGTENITFTDSGDPNSPRFLEVFVEEDAVYGTDEYPRADYSALVGHSREHVGEKAYIDGKVLDVDVVDGKTILIVGTSGMTWDDGRFYVLDRHMDLHTGQNGYRIMQYDFVRVFGTLIGEKEVEFFSLKDDEEDGEEEGKEDGGRKKKYDSVRTSGMPGGDEDDEIIALLRSETRNLPLIDAEQVFFTVNWR